MIQIVRLVIINPKSGNLFYCFIIHTTEKIETIINSTHLCAFSRCRNPAFNLDLFDSNINTFSFQNSLYISLQPPSQPLNQLIPWNIVSWLGNKQIRPIIIVEIRLDSFDFCLKSLQRSETLKNKNDKKNKNLHFQLIIRILNYQIHY